MRFQTKAYWAASLILLLVTIISKLYFLNGFSFGLDYGLFHPDGMLYSFKSLSVLGESQASAGKMVSDFYLTNSSSRGFISPESLYFENNSNWQIFNLRVLYPFLSAPFVYVFGLWGMLVVPVLSFSILWIFAFFAFFVFFCFNKSFFIKKIIFKKIHKIDFYFHLLLKEYK